MTKQSDETYSPAETARRRDAIVRNMIATPPAPHLSLKAKKKASRPKRATAKAKKRA
jgi:hypothetical protein